jgi:hypothetical protein
MAGGATGRPHMPQNRRAVPCYDVTRNREATVEVTRQAKRRVHVQGPDTYTLNAAGVNEMCQALYDMVCEPGG